MYVEYPIKRNGEETYESQFGNCDCVVKGRLQTIIFFFIITLHFYTYFTAFIEN